MIRLDDMEDSFLDNIRGDWQALPLGAREGAGPSDDQSFESWDPGMEKRDPGPAVGWSYTFWCVRRSAWLMSGQSALWRVPG